MKTSSRLCSSPPSPSSSFSFPLPFFLPATVFSFPSSPLGKRFFASRREEGLREFPFPPGNGIPPCIKEKERNKSYCPDLRATGRLRRKKIKEGKVPWIILRRTTRRRRKLFRKKVGRRNSYFPLLKRFMRAFLLFLFLF